MVMRSPLESKRAAAAARTEAVEEQLQRGIDKSFLGDREIRDALDVLLPHRLLQQTRDQHSCGHIGVGVRAELSTRLAFAHQRRDQPRSGLRSTREPAAKRVGRLVRNALEQQRYY